MSFEGVISTIIPNQDQKVNGAKVQMWEPVTVIGKEKEDLPTQLTRLGERKVNHLVTALGKIGPNDRVLELFGGTGLSTAIIARCLPASLITVDLHYGPETQVAWWYDAPHNFKQIVKGLGIKRYTKPTFIPGDAAHLNLEDQSFEVVVAPDSPRTAASRSVESESLHATLISGTETHLTPKQQAELFAAASQEAYRVLTSRGRYVGTAPYSWVKQLIDAGYSNLEMFGNPGTGQDVQPLNDQKLQFKVDQMNDPVVYFRAIK